MYYFKVRLIKKNITSKIWDFDQYQPGFQFSPEERIPLAFAKYKSALIFWWIVDQFYEKIFDRSKVADAPVER